jgi:DNA replication and repair protein RecF
MFVRGVNIESFRNINHINISLSQGINIIYGDNAQGKTNFLEAIYFCAMGRPIRSSSDKELINFNAAQTMIRAELNRDGSPRTIDVYLKQEGNKLYKHFSIDRIPIKKTNDLFGLLLVVMFSPDELRLIKSGPSERRAFMDMELCQINPVYCHELRSYHHALKQRNALLKTIQKENRGRETLPVWEEQLCRHARKVMSTRSDFIGKASIYASETHSSITGGGETLSLVYVPNVEDPSMMGKILEESRGRDILLGSTSRGAHKDDIRFMINGRDAKAYGSQGQIRTASLAAKLAEIEIIRENTGTAPVLLLDDVLSELDGSRQRFLLSRIGQLQTILTCTGVEDILGKDLLPHAGDINVMCMEDGFII